jgi:hypothetical protein
VRPAWRSLELVVSRKKGQAESGPTDRRPSKKDNPTEEKAGLKRRTSFKKEFQFSRKPKTRVVDLDPDPH